MLILMITVVLAIVQLHTMTMAMMMTGTLSRQMAPGGWSRGGESSNQARFPTISGGESLSPIVVALSVMILIILRVVLSVMMISTSTWVHPDNLHGFQKFKGTLFSRHVPLP